MKTEELLARIQKVDPADDLFRRVELRIASRTVIVPMRLVYRVAASFLLIATLECAILLVSSPEKQTELVQQVDNQLYR